MTAPTDQQTVAEPLIEQFAALSHEQWSGWYLWMAAKWDQTHASCETFRDRWERQAITPYADLSETEKNSDRIEARKMAVCLATAAQQTVAELARHNQELSLALSAAEQRARTAEQRVKLLTSACEDYRDDLTAARAENKILQRTAELQLALLTATADVVEALRAWFAALDASEEDGEDEASIDAGHACYLALKALDQASPREPQAAVEATHRPASPIGPSETAN